MKKLLSVFILGAFIGMVAVFFAAPYYTVYQLQQAAQAHDSERLNRYIDYPAVRAHLKDSLSQALSQTLLEEKTDSGMNAFATQFANAFVSPLVDNLVTPNNVALMLQAKRPKKFKETQQPYSHDAQDDDTHEELITQQTYVDLNTFVVDIAQAKQPHTVFKLTLTRQGIIHWKLTGLTLPKI